LGVSRGGDAKELKQLGKAVDRIAKHAAQLTKTLHRLDVAAPKKAGRRKPATVRKPRS